MGVHALRILSVTPGLDQANLWDSFWNNHSRTPGCDGTASLRNISHALVIKLVFAVKYSVHIPAFKLRDKRRTTVFLFLGKLLGSIRVEPL